jgi:hypothetical protein
VGELSGELGGVQNMTCLEGTQQRLVHAHHRTGIIKLSAIIGRRKQGNKLSLSEKLVSVLDDLVRSANEIHVVLLKEAPHDIRTECERYTTIVFAPPGDVLVWV